MQVEVLVLVMKNSLLEQINSDYIRTVYAKGGSTSRALWGHALRNALVPVVTIIGLQLGSIIAFALVTETTGAPCWYLRGNHETRGAYARHLRDYLALVEGHYYGAVTLGPARIVFVDTGEDKRDDHAEYSGLVDFDGYLAAQTAWLKAETEGEAWRSAKFRIVVEHIPATTGAYNPGVERLRKLQEVLKTAKVSAMFAAHLHRRGWHDPIPERPYPMIVGGGPYPEPKNPIHSATLTRCDIEGDTMRISQFDVTGTKVVDKMFTS